VQVAIRSRDGKDSGECNSQKVSVLDCNFGVSGDPWVRTGAVVKAFFKLLQRLNGTHWRNAGGTLAGKMHEWDVISEYP